MTEVVAEIEQDLDSILFPLTGRIPECGDESGLFSDDHVGEARAFWKVKLVGAQTCGHLPLEGFLVRYGTGTATHQEV
jgi:hypothetical protein